MRTSRAARRPGEVAHGQVLRVWPASFPLAMTVRLAMTADSTSWGSLVRAQYRPFAPSASRRFRMVMRDRRDTQGTNARRVQTPVQTSDLAEPCNRLPRPDVFRESLHTLLGRQRIRRMRDTRSGSDSTRD